MAKYEAARETPSRDATSDFWQCESPDSQICGRLDNGVYAEI
jgi:hypothetical protein